MDRGAPQEVLGGGVIEARWRVARARANRKRCLGRDFALWRRSSLAVLHAAGTQARCEAFAMPQYRGQQRNSSVRCRMSDWVNARRERLATIHERNASVAWAERNPSRSMAGVRLIGLVRQRMQAPSMGWMPCRVPRSAQVASSECHPLSKETKPPSAWRVCLEKTYAAGTA